MPAPRPNPPPPRPSRALTVAALTFATVSISAGIAIMVAPLGRTSEAWAMPTAYTADLLIVPLFVVFTFVSLLLFPRGARHRPLPQARANGAASVPAGSEAAPTS